MCRYIDSGANLVDPGASTLIVLLEVSRDQVLDELKNCRPEAIDSGDLKQSICFAEAILRSYNIETMFYAFCASKVIASQLPLYIAITIGKPL